MNTTEDYDLFCVKHFVGALVWGIFSVPCACVGVAASVWLLWVLVQRHRRGSGSSSHVYMLNLTVMDLIYNVSKFPSVLNFFVWHDLQVLQICFFFEGLNFNGRPLFMACSCVDCYMAVVHPIRYMRISQSRYRAVVCAVVWVFTLLCGVWNKFTGPWAIPRILSILTIAFCDLFVLRILTRPDPSGRTTVHPQKQRALQTIVNSFVMTAVSFLPSVIVYMSAPFTGLVSAQLYCNIMFPVTVNSVLGSTLLPLLCLENLGKLAVIKRFGCGREK